MPETSRRPVAIESVLAEHGRLVESALDRYLPSESAPPEAVLPAACAVELIHTYSLIRLLERER